MFSLWFTVTARFQCLHLNNLEHDLTRGSSILLLMLHSGSEVQDELPMQFSSDLMKVQGGFTLFKMALLLSCKNLIFAFVLKRKNWEAFKKRHTCAYEGESFLKG